MFIMLCTCVEGNAALFVIVKRRDVAAGLCVVAPFQTVFEEGIHNFWLQYTLAEENANESVADRKGPLEELE